MRHKTKAGESVVTCRSYWVKPDEKELPKEVMDEAFNMNLFWNRLVEIGERYRGRYLQLLSEKQDVNALNEELARADEKAAAACEELKRAKVTYRTKRGPALAPFTDVYRALLKEKKGIIRKLKEARKEAKAELKGRIKDLFSEFDSAVTGEWKKAYPRETGYLYWANANAVADAYRTSWQRGMKTGRFPKYHRFTGEGRWCVQLIGGLDTGKLFTGGSRLISIRPVDSAAYTDKSLKKSQTKKMLRSILTYRMGKATVQFHINLHREVPRGLLKRAVIVKKRIGTHEEWSLSLTIGVRGQAQKEERLRKVAAIDLGFRIIDGRMRIGVLAADDKSEDLWLPPKILDAKAHADEVKRKKDLIFEDVKNEVCEIFSQDLPAELMSNWDKARQPRLIKIMHYLKTKGHPFAGELEKWHRKDRRLYNEYRGLEARALRHRKWYYYNLAHRLCRKYSTIVIEDLDLAAMSRKEINAEPNELVQKAKGYMRIAALGEFIKIVKDVAAKSNTEICELEAANTTLIHHPCGNFIEAQDMSKRMLSCDICNARFDQDVNAAWNLYRNHSGAANLRQDVALRAF